MTHAVHAPPKAAVAAFVVVALACPPAYAYLDPATGNAFLLTLASLFAVVVYAVKGACLRVLRMLRGERSGSELADDDVPIAMFSEGRAYWNTYQPIVDALRRKKVQFRYYSLDLHDPGLTVECPYMRPRFLGFARAAHTRLSRLKAEVLLSTTPNIGTPRYPITRSRAVKKLAHVFHAVGDVASYRKGSLDHYDAVFLHGAHQVASIRALEKLRNLPAKELIEGGLPYLDALAEHPLLKERPRTNGKTVLVGPTWDKKGCLRVYGSGFIKQLAEAGYDVIVRPHPQSYRVEADLLARIRKELAALASVSFDADLDGMPSLAKADLLISDISGLRFDFALLLARPVLTLATPKSDLSDYEASDLGTLWEEDVSRRLGRLLAKDDVEHIAEHVARTLAEFTPEHLTALRPELLFNWRNSGEVIARHLVQCTTT